MLRRLAPALATLALAAFALAPRADAQPSRSGPVRGRVVDADTGEPLPGAHVFFSTTMKGTATDAEGRFAFSEGVPVGTQRLHVSMMGYRTQVLDTLLHAGRRYRLRLALEPAVIETQEVTVAERGEGWSTVGDERWQQRLEKFKRLFVGETPEAEHVTLTNPEALALHDNWWGQMQAATSGPLIFENRALGYRVRYHLKEFEGSHAKVRWDGEPFFEPLTPVDSAEAARWRTNRRRAFRGSLRHFLLALLGDSLKAAGFQIQREPSRGMFGSRRRHVRFNPDPEDLLESPPAAARDTLPQESRLLEFRGRLRITYTREPEGPAYARWKGARRAPRRIQRSYIEIDDEAVTIDPAGEIIEPYGATLFGYFAFERLTVLLPKEYRP